MPELSAYYQAGGLVDSVINQGLPAPIDIQNQVAQGYDELHSHWQRNWRRKSGKSMPNVSNVYIPQSIGHIRDSALNIGRERASLIGLSAKDVWTM